MSIIRNRPTDELRTLVRRLGGTWPGDTAMWHCLAHADRTHSLSIRQGARGVLVTCHAGCDSRDVLRELSRIARIPNFNRTVIEKANPNPGGPHLAIWRAARPIDGPLAERYVRDTRNIWVPLGDLRYHPRCPEGQGPLAAAEAVRGGGSKAPSHRRPIPRHCKIILASGCSAWVQLLCRAKSI